MIEIILPEPPNRSQDTGHWANKYQGKTAYRSLCFPVLYEAFKPLPAPADASKFQKVRMCAALYSWNKNDADAIQGRLKWAIDALVYYRIIPDDDPAHLELGIVTQKIDRKHRRLVIWIEEII